MEENAISLKEISKSFGTVKVLDNVDFDLKKGSVHALVGGNGAGKSTLMKILTGVYSHDQGTILVDGKPAEMKTYSDAVNKGISLIFQELSLIPTLSIVENIFLNRELSRFRVLSKAKMRTRSLELLAELGISADPSMLIKDLDVGVCQMIEIAKAMAVNARVIIMDEPTASLTEKETETLFGLVGQLKKKGVSIIYISHRMNEVFKICDEISVLRNGKVVAHRKTADYTMETLIGDIIGNKERKAFVHTSREDQISDETLLEVRNLSMGLRLQDVSFRLRRGEILGFAGLMASGRTETLEALFGVQPSDSGTVILEGTPRRFRSVQEAIRAGVVLIPEDRRREGLVLEHSVLENLCLPNLNALMRGFKLNRRLAGELASDSVQELKIKTPSVQTVMEDLSGGNQQKVVISKWLKTKPKVLMMDEPTAGIDIGAKAEIMQLVRDFASKKNGVIFVSSELTELMAVCDRVLIFQKGRIVGEMLASQIQDEEVLQHAIQH
jgi:ribose transport system ATP-binding protein